MNRIQRDEARRYPDQNGMLRKRHQGRGWNILAVLLVIAGVILMCYEPIKTYLVQSYSPQVSRSSIDHQMAKPADYNFSNAKPLTMHQILKARLTGRISTVGEILVPGQIHLPIGLGVSNTTLALAAGTMRPHMKMGHGNYALAGHHMINRRALFTPLYYHANLGTRVYLTDLNHVYVYRLNERKIISPYDVGVARNARRSILTLITCNDSGSKRLMMRGKLIGKMKLSRAPSNLKRQLKQKMNNYNVFEGY